MVFAPPAAWGETIEEICPREGPVSVSVFVPSSETQSAGQQLGPVAPAPRGETIWEIHPGKGVISVFVSPSAARGEVIGKICSGEGPPSVFVSPPEMQSPGKHSALLGPAVADPPDALRETIVEVCLWEGPCLPLFLTPAGTQSRSWCPGLRAAAEAVVAVSAQGARQREMWSPSKLLKLLTLTAVAVAFFAALEETIQAAPRLENLPSFLSLLWTLSAGYPPE